MNTAHFDLNTGVSMFVRYALATTAFFRAGARVCLSDVVTGAPLTDEVRRDLDLHCVCLAGASVMDELRVALEAAGFAKVRIQPKDESREFIKAWAPGLQLEEAVVSALIEAVKPQLLRVR